MNKLLIMGLLFFAAACTNTEIGDSDDIAPEAIAQQIDVNYNPNDGLSAQIRFRVSGLNGTTLVLNKPATVSLDGAMLKVDSSGGAGAFYKNSVSTAPGNHTFNYNDKDGKSYKNNFSFNGFALAKELPKTISKANSLEIEFKGIAPTATINYHVSDTSFGNSVDGKADLINNKLVLSPNQLAKLKPGPITIELSHQNTLPLQNGTKEGGEINYNYELNKIKAKLQ